MNRVHLEEDAAKLTHKGEESYIDFNRSSLPLVEAVTEPDIRSIEEASAVLRAMRRLVRHLGVSTADMEKGQMRCDASISLRPEGEEKLYSRVEIKNLNSFKAVESALAHEQKRLLKLWEAGTPLADAETVLFDEQTGETRFMRGKESEADYRFMSEPDIPEVELSREYVEELRKTLPWLPYDQIKFFIEHGIELGRAESLTEDEDVSRALGKLIEKTSSDEKLKEIAIKKFLELPRELKVSVDYAYELIRLLHEEKLTGLQYKKVVVATDPKKTLREIVEGGDDKVDIEAVIASVMAENGAILAEYRAGKERALNVLIGVVIKKTGGSVAAQDIKKALESAAGDSLG